MTQQPRTRRTKQPTAEPAYDATTGEAIEIPAPAAPVSVTSHRITITMDVEDALMLQRCADMRLSSAAVRAAFDARYSPGSSKASKSVDHACSRIAIALSEARDAARKAAPK